MAHARRIFAALAVFGLALTGCGSESPEAARDRPGLDALREYRSLRVPTEAPDPVAVSIPAIGIDGPLTRTGLNDDRTLEVPDFGDMSWFAGGVAPGDPGPAAILGHVDTRRGPDVFYRLHELRPGDTITVTAKGDKSLTFVVDRVEQHAKAKFPTKKVWLPTAKPQLRLITCGGEFDRAERSYRDNVIAFASLRHE